MTSLMFRPIIRRVKLNVNRQYVSGENHFSIDNIWILSYPQIKNKGGDLIDIIQVNAKLPTDLYRKLKVVSAERGIPMKELIRMGIEHIINSKKKDS